MDGELAAFACDKKMYNRTSWYFLVSIHLIFQTREMSVYKNLHVSIYNFVNW